MSPPMTNEALSESDSVALETFEGEDKSSQSGRVCLFRPRLRSFHNLLGSFFLALWDDCRSLLFLESNNLSQLVMDHRGHSPGL